MVLWFSTVQMHVICAVKYICSNTGEKLENEEVGSKCKTSVWGITLESGHQACIRIIKDRSRGQKPEQSNKRTWQKMVGHQSWIYLAMKLKWLKMPSNIV